MEGVAARVRVPDTAASVSKGTGWVVCDFNRGGRVAVRVRVLAIAANVSKGNKRGRRSVNCCSAGASVSKGRRQQRAALLI